MDNPIEIQTVIKASAAQVWKALTDKTEMKNWYFDIQDFQPVTGNVFDFYEPGDHKKYHHVGEVLEVIPEKKLSYTWTYPDFSTVKTTVLWEIKEMETGETSVKVTHRDTEKFSELGENFSRKSFAEGWRGILNQSLKPFLEK
ncbi:SRPBCC family protein [Chryseobacterium caseinilyticum]|uniref:SRPBCC domain-containing protein n=1 Tax=Chryseobacterium caseinilyticum TaxID=2771428 RepID=A0ABR8Z7B8_9FLAO|nr:SRPBCC domain-containing protein [Chryseobacterium caseinilyticum]MBD8081174.1 SRPBCC domain-containing protein [Chryseobacterium caseinilyticum]